MGETEPSSASPWGGESPSLDSEEKVSIKPMSMITIYNSKIKKNTFFCICTLVYESCVVC